MRISTATLYDTGLRSITQQQSNLLRTQQQIATGKRISTPSDDPVAATQILQLNQSVSINKQYTANQDAAKDLLAQTDSTLSQVSNLLQNVRVNAVNAGNPVMSNQDRVSMAAELQGQLDELISLANSKDGNGNYFFSGYQTGTQPFAKTAAGVNYVGDEGQRLIQVSSSRQMEVSSSGADVFQRIKSGNGVFTTAAAVGNSGSGIVDAGQVTSPSNLTGHNYQINFSVVGATTTYSVTDTTTGLAVNAPAATGNLYINNGTISFDGLQFNMSGAPANGDQFTVAPSTNQSIFTTLQNFVNSLRTPLTGDSSRAIYNNQLGSTLQNIDQAIDKNLTVRASVGARLNEIDMLSTAAADADLQYKSRLSDLQDTDYAEAISNLNMQQIMLDAAQKSFANITSKNLFDYL